MNAYNCPTSQREKGTAIQQYVHAGRSDDDSVKSFASVGSLDRARSMRAANGRMEIALKQAAPR